MHTSEFAIRPMCEVLQVARSGYYDWLSGQERRAQHKLLEQQLLAQVREIFEHYRRYYGARRIRYVLQSQGVKMSRRRVSQLMKRAGLVCQSKRKHKVTRDSEHALLRSPNVLSRGFEAKEADVKYVGDITYLKTVEGWLYLAVVIDLFSRRVVGWAMKAHMRASLVNEALLMAIWQRKPKAGLIWHTDQGSQYASESHRKIIKEHGIVQSMSRKGDCWDNAVSESFFRTLKREVVMGKRFKTRREARRAIFEYIEVYYNRQRHHSSNGYLTPEEYERQDVKS